MKFKRVQDDHWTGTGNTIFKSELFYVVQWHQHDDTDSSTTIECYLLDTRFRFMGHQNFLTDEACFEQFNYDEILEIISQLKKVAFEDGKRYKAKQIRDCLKM